MKKPTLQRALSLLLALIMLCSLVPMQAIAAHTTIQGDRVTVEMGANAAAKRENNFNKGWKFYYGDNSAASGWNFNDSAWADVNLPHDFSITQHFTTSGEAESGFLPGGTGWYRKSFVLSKDVANKTFLLNFDGAYKDAYVYVNGNFVGEHHYGYSNFAFDISSHLVCDGSTQNVVAVKVVNQLPTSRWYSGSGIYRDVTLYAMDPVHVDLNGVQITTPNISSGNGTASVVTDLINDSDSSVTATVKTTITTKDSSDILATAETTVSIGANGTASATTSPVVDSPKLWSLENPNLYTMHVEVIVNDTVVDTETSDFGYRWFSWSSEGFALNGENVKLNGVCLHHDQGALGAAAYYDAMYRQLSIMKDMGCNAIRTSHNPADEQFIEICSKLGLLVIEEHFDGITQVKNSNSNDFSKYFTQTVDSGLYGAEDDMLCSEYVVRSIVKRDRNAPAVFAWSYGNEIQEGNYVDDPNYATYSLKYIEWINEEDGTRIATIGDNTKASGYSYVNATLQNILNAGGVVGFNYHCHQANSQTLVNNWGGNYNCFIASETSSHVNSRGRYMSMDGATSIDGAYHLTSYDTSAVSWGDTAHDSMYDTLTKDYIAGEFVWTGFDYIGEPTPWNGTDTGSISDGRAIPNSSYFGIVETTGFEKDTYYLYRSQWNKDATTVHLVTAWDSDNQMISGSTTPVWMYSNAPVVKLYLNDSLIATSTRTVNTTDAGHTYYTYTSVSNNGSVCTAAKGSGADALYGAYNVVYTAGTLKAVACETDGTELATYSVTTPGTVTKLKATANKTTFNADGSSLIYVEVDVLDAAGVLDTTATNNITFTVNGPAEIAGVDNGDQATLSKYQNSNVLNTARTEANINAYAGKALVILRSTEETGDITLTIASNGLTGQTVNVTSVDSTGEEITGIVSYEMIRDYTVKAGTNPELNTTITANLADGKTVDGTITWNTVPADVYGIEGDYTITGVASFTGYDSIDVTAKLHVIPNVIDLRNISAATMQGTAPTLPNTVRGVLADGTLAGEFAVAWDSIPTAADCDVVGEIITVTGTAVIFGDETMNVTCTVRVAEALNSESTNVAGAAALSQDIPAEYQSDKLSSIIDGNTNPGESDTLRWTNWGNRYNSDTATITLSWATAVRLSDVNLYYRYDSTGCEKPASVVFSYSLDGVTFKEIAATESAITDVTVSNGAAFTYALSEVINPIALSITFTQQGGTSGGKCVGVYEVETMTYAASYEVNSSADLSGITVDGAAIDSFSADTLAYEAAGTTVAATTADNAGITVLPVYEGVVRILTVSEDGSIAKTYEITTGEAEVCTHSNVELQGKIDATCTTDGYTGDTYCKDCGELISSGTVQEATGHNWSDWDVTDATCTADGSKTRTCSACHETETQTIAATGHSWSEWTVTSTATCTADGSKSRTCSGCGNTETQTIAAAGHSWDNGVITQEPTETVPGVKTYTCTTCGTTKTEEVAYQKELKTPTVSLTLSTNASTGRIVITGQIGDYENSEDYYEIVGQGILYIRSSRIGTRTLTVNTSGRTRVNFSTVKEDGSFVYNLKPTSKSTAYTYRAFIIYKNTETGKTVTVYSGMMRGSYNTFN